MKNNIIMLAQEGDLTNAVFNSLSKEFQIDAVIIENSEDKGKFLKRRMKRLGIKKVIGQILFIKLIVPIIQKQSKERIDEIKQEYKINIDKIDEDKIKRVSSVNDQECIELLKELNPQVVVVNGTRIISKEVLEHIDAKFINMHVGITPLYRGVHGGYWALANKDEQNCGVTIHLIDQGVDTGGIISQDTIEVSRRDSFVTYPYLQVAKGLELEKRAIKDALSNSIKILEEPLGQSKMWSHPTFLEYLKNIIKYKVK